MKRTFILIVLFSFLTSSFGLAQEESSMRGNIAKIIYGGLGGAVIGLSTLSFYGKPEDHLSNVMFGFAAGILGGAAYVTYNSVYMPRENNSIAEMNYDQNNRIAKLDPAFLTFKFAF